VQVNSEIEIDPLLLEIPINYLVYEFIKSDKSILGIHDKENNSSLALFFQDEEGCKEIWEFICCILQNQNSKNPFLNYISLPEFNELNFQIISDLLLKNQTLSKMEFIAEYCLDQQNSFLKKFLDLFEEFLKNSKSQEILLMSKLVVTFINTSNFDLISILLNNYNYVKIFTILECIIQ